MALLLVAGCGESSRTHSASKEDQAGIRSTVSEFLDAFEKADAARICAVMTPTLRDHTARRLGELAPLVRGKPCGQAMLAFYTHLPIDEQPPAANEAAKWNHRGTEVQGERASVRFGDGSQWTFIKSGGRWLISDFPILPPGVPASSG